MYNISSYQLKLFDLIKYVGPPYCRTEMYAGRVACCSLVSHSKYIDGTDRRTDARPVTLSFSL